MTTLFLYHVERHDPYGMDEFSDFVVCAASEDEARKTHPRYPTMFLNETEDQWMELEFTGKIYESRYPAWVKATEINTLTVELIGTALPSKDKGIISTSFHAG